MAEYASITPDLVAVKDCKEVLGVSRSMVYSLEKSKKIKFYRLKSRVYVKRSELEKCMESE